MPTPNAPSSASEAKGHNCSAKLICVDSHLHNRQRYDRMMLMAKTSKMNISQAAAILGALGGAASKGISTSRKAQAARENGRKGGRPRHPKPDNYVPFGETSAQRAIHMRLHNFSYADIANMLNVSRQRAQQLVKPNRDAYLAVQARAGFKCEQCRKPVRFGHVHHILQNRPTVETFNDPTNIAYLCISCHGKVRD
jgi:general stress protein YciG